MAVGDTAGLVDPITGEGIYYAMRSGDLLATSTISGPNAGSEGCLLEKQHNAEPIRLPSGEMRAWLEDGNRVTLRAYAQRPGLPRIGFGLCSGTISGAVYE